MTSLSTGDRPDGTGVHAWYIIYVDDPQSEVRHAQWQGWPGSLGQFHRAAKTGMVEDRRVLGMWIIDQSTFEGEIVERFGYVPAAVPRSYGPRAARDAHARDNPSPAPSTEK